MLAVVLSTQPPAQISTNDTVTMAVWVAVYIATTVGLVAAAYYIWPRRFRQRRLWLKMPLSMMAIETLLLTTAGILEYYNHTLSYCIAATNLPLVLLLQSSAFGFLKNSADDFWPAGAVMVSLMLFGVTLVPLVTGLVLDHKHRRREEVAM